MRVCAPEVEVAGETVEVIEMKAWRATPLVCRDVLKADAAVDTRAVAVLEHIFGPL